LQDLFEGEMPLGGMCDVLSYQVPLAPERKQKLLEETERDDRIIVRLFLESGMRLSEGLSLRWTQVDRTGGAILINKSKTGKARSVPLNVRLTAVLDDVTRHIRSDYVLCDREGRPLSRYVVARQVESALERAEFAKAKGTNLNLLRHTFGSRLAEAGVSMATIATIMGNSEAVCMRHYIRFSPGHLRAAMATLDTPTAPPTVPGAGGGRSFGDQERQEVAGA